MENMSELEKLRACFKPAVPNSLKSLTKIDIKETKTVEPTQDAKEIQEMFPHTYLKPVIEFIPKENQTPSTPLKVGVVFSGGQASGGHNVIAGLFDALQSFNKKSRLYGFLGGPSGIVENKTVEITASMLKSYRNQGGFDLIGSGRTKIETKEQLASSLKTVQSLQLDGLVIIGGDDSNTNAAILAEYFLKNNSSTIVVGVPKTIDGDLRGEYIEMSFGFDTACKIYSEMIGNICKDALSAKKYYHFVRLMGRSASHIALECALKTRPNYTLIGEEIADKKLTLDQVVDLLTDLVCKRSKEGKDFGVILLPEGMIEFIPEMKQLISTLNQFLAKDKKMNALKEIEEKRNYLKSHLDQALFHCFSSLPEKIQEQLLFDRDPHGNLQVSKIETEKLMVDLVKTRLKQRKDYSGKFNGVCHFFGYEGRAALPSNFDAQYCYSLGLTAALLIQNKLTGYMACLCNLKQGVENWKAKGVPITMLMNLEMRSGKPKPVIKKFLVDLKAKTFQNFSNIRQIWQIEDAYQMPGPIQFFGEKKITESLPFSLLN